MVLGLAAAGGGAACGGESQPVGAAPPDAGVPGAPPPLADAAPTQAPVGDAAPDAPAGPAPAPLTANRDRLLDTLATHKGAATRCALWKGLTPTQAGVFLTVTDLLGKRSFMTNDPPGGAKRTAAIELMTALDHVTKLYELRDKGSGNGGGDNNRIWLQVDAALATALRTFTSGLPEWEKSSDLAGPHDPFDATSETVNGQPRGQAHFWSADGKSKPLTRPGVEGIDDPRIVEIDIDYNLLHDSNPLGEYFAGLGTKTGLELYAAKWTPLGVGGDPELGYVPTGCTP